MKRIFIFSLAAVLILALCGCNIALPLGNTGANAAVPGSVNSICIESKGTVVVDDENGRYEYTTMYTHDEVIRRADGLIEVRGTSSVDGVSSKVRWLYTADGKQIARRTYENGSYSDYSAIFDSTVESYALYLQGVASTEEHVVHYEDGAREVININEYGLTENVRIYNSGEELPYLMLTTEYIMLTI